MGANQHTSKGRTVQYRIMFTTDEKRALDARAVAEGVTLADLIRTALALPAPPVVCRWCGREIAAHSCPDIDETSK